MKKIKKYPINGIIICPKCKARVLLKADGTCPSCLAYVSKIKPIRSGRNFVETNEISQVRSSRKINSTNNFVVGAAIGVVIVFVISNIFVLGISGSGSGFLGIIIALIFGAPAGGFGGMILEKRWKVKNAGIIGSVIAGIIISLLLFGVAPFFIGF